MISGRASIVIGAPLITVACAQVLGIDEHLPRPLDGGASDGSSARDAAGSDGTGGEMSDGAGQDVAAGVGGLGGTAGAGAGGSDAGVGGVGASGTGGMGGTSTGGSSGSGGNAGGCVAFTGGDPCATCICTQCGSNPDLATSCASDDRCAAILGCMRSGAGCCPSTDPSACASSCIHVAGANAVLITDLASCIRDSGCPCGSFNGCGSCGGAGAACAGPAGCCTGLLCLSNQCNQCMPGIDDSLCASQFGAAYKCCPGLTCGTCGSGSGGAGGVGGTAGAAGGGGAGGSEACNFVDDDGNGAVDEGYGWIVRAPIRLSDAQVDVRAAPLSDGRVAVASIPSGAPRAILEIVDPAGGAIPSRVISVPVPVAAATEARVVYAGSSRVAVAIGTTTAAPCSGAPGCPVIVEVIDLGSWSPVNQATLDEAFFGFRPGGVVDLAWTGTELVLAVKEATATGSVQLVWTALTVATVSFVRRDAPQAAMSIVEGSLATSPTRLAWLGKPFSGGTLWASVYSSSGAALSGSPWPVPDALAASGRMLTWVGSELGILYYSVPGTGARVDRRGESGPVFNTSPSIPGCPSGITPRDIADVGGGPAVVCDNGNVLRVSRLDATLAPVGMPLTVTSSMPGDASSIARSGTGLVVVRRTGTTVDAFPIECPP